MKRASKGYTEENIPLFPAMIVQGLVVQSEGSTHPVESHHTPTSAPSTSQPPVSLTSKRITRQESVVSQPISPTQTLVADETVHEERETSNDSPLPRVNTLGSDEGSMIQQELMVFCTTLSKKVESLETDVKQTKQLYGAAYTRLIKKVKKLEKTTMFSQARIRVRIVVFYDKDDLEDPSKQGRKIAAIDQDLGISLALGSTRRSSELEIILSVPGQDEASR
ncbi:hypothetical protein Tco_1358020 [Tanacetum coccineum]